jgi:hypothetical protein
MSYAVGGNSNGGRRVRKEYTQINGGDDDEKLANPLVSGNLNRQKQTIENQM